MPLLIAYLYLFMLHAMASGSFILLEFLSVLILTMIPPKTNKKTPTKKEEREKNPARNKTKHATRTHTQSPPAFFHISLDLSSE